MLIYIVNINANIYCRFVFIYHVRFNQFKVGQCSISTYLNYQKVSINFYQFL